MTRNVSLLALFFCSAAQADTKDVPLLPDGTVDVEAVIRTFSAASPATTTGTMPEFTGSLLGQAYTANYDAADLIKPFDLRIRSEGLSEHATYLAALLLNDIICLKSDLQADVLMWRETAVPLGEGWSVKASCSKRTEDVQNSNGGNRLKPTAMPPAPSTP